MSERCRYVFLGCRGEPPWTRLPYTPSVSLRGGAHSLSISVYLSSCILSKCVYGSLQVGKDFEQGPYSQGLRPLAQPFQEKPAGHPADRVHVNVTSSFRGLCMLPLLSSSTLDIQIAIFKAAASLPRPERNWADQRAPIRHQDLAIHHAHASYRLSIHRAVLVRYSMRMRTSETACGQASAVCMALRSIGVLMFS